MEVYLDTNVFYNAYCPVEDNALADWLLDQLSPTFPGVTCEWTILEMFRALKKQVNLETIEADAAKITLDFFLSELGEMTEKKALVIIPVTRSAIMASRKQIFEHNLYAADALHASIASSALVKAFITFDGDFNANIGDIPIWNPTGSKFKDKIVTLTTRYNELGGDM